MGRRTLRIVVALLVSIASACSLLVDASDLSGRVAPAGDAGAAEAATNDSPTSAGDAGASKYAAAVLADKPIAYWRFGVTSGSSVPDETGRGNALLLQGTGHRLAAAGAIANDPDTAVEFDGLGAFAVATDPTPLAFAGTQPFTVECWAKRTGGVDYYQHLLGSSGGSGSKRDGYIVYILPKPTGSDSAYVSLEWDAPDASGATAGGDLPPLGVYAHYMGTFDGTRAHLYVDGTEKAPSDPRVGAPSPRSAPFVVASDHGGGSYFAGSVDELAVYDRALGLADAIRHRDIGRGK